MAVLQAHMCFSSPSLSLSFSLPLPNPTITTTTTTSTTADVDGDQRSLHLKVLFSPMPAQKRPAPDNLVDGGVDEEEEQEGRDEDSLFHRKQPRHLETEQAQPQDHLNQHPQLLQEEDSDENPSSSIEEKPEFVFVGLPDIRKDVQCPICLGIIKKTRTVMECLHRFCRECIDKSMRLGNNECPACRTHCASRRSLRDDPNYDALIAALYPDIDKYEEEELAFHEEEQTRNKQIQASIAQILQRQSEALNRKRALGKDIAGPFMTRSQRNYRNAYSRRRKSSRGSDLQGSDDNEDENDNDGGKCSSSTEERSTEVKRRRYKRRAGIRLIQSSSVANSDAGCIENDPEVNRESRGISPGLVWNPEMLAWGRGGARSHTRHGSSSSCNNKIARGSRLSKLVDYLRSLGANDNELDVHLMLVSLDKESTPSLQQPYLCCRPTLSVRHLREYVALQTPLRADEVEILVVKSCHSGCQNPSASVDDANPGPIRIDPSKDELQILEGQETLVGIQANGTFSRNHLILAYRQKG